MSDILEKIVAYKREEIAAAKLRRPQDELARTAESASPVRGFTSAIRQCLADRQIALIAEVKKASPSKGLIRADFDPATLARAYQAGGAACLSVLTDTPSFQGRPEFLSDARDATALPVLRKDFMLDPYQVTEARVLGADCILLILAVLDDETARGLLGAAAIWDMDVLVEVHDEAELDRALDLDASLIGINNRNLKTFETTLETTERLAPRIPGDRIVVSESGISTNAHVARLAEAGVGAFLVGESLMREADVEAATRRLLAPARQPAAAQ